MKIIIVAFDALDYYYVKRYDIASLKQEINGHIGLFGYRRGGGNPDYLTDEILASFITGTVPDVHGVKFPIDLKYSLKGKMKTIFDLCDSVAVDVPSWNRHPEHVKFQTRVGWFLGHEEHRTRIGMDSDEYWEKVMYERVNLEPDIYRHLDEQKKPRIMEALAQDAQLTMIYFWFSDILGHVIKGGTRLERIYNVADDVFQYIKLFGGEDTLYMLMSDHGMNHGIHDPDGAIWSLSKPLLRHDDIVEIEEWFPKIEEWLNV